MRIKKAQKYKDEGQSWKSLAAGSLTFLDLGVKNHAGEQCRVGVDSSKIQDTSKVQRHVTDLESRGVDERVKWFKEQYPGIRPIFISENVISGLGKTEGPDRNVTATGSFELKWNK